MNTQKFEIKEVIEYRPEVREVISHLLSQLDTNAQPLTETDLRSIISSDATHLYGAYDKEQNALIGMLTLVVYRIPYKKKGWVEDVVVDSSYRGQGIGTALMEWAIQEAKRLQLQVLDLTSRPKREQANQLYNSLGFEKRETNVYRLDLQKTTV